MTAPRARTSVLPRKTVMIGLALGLPVSAGFLFLAARNIDAGAARDAVRDADGWSLALAVILVLLMYCVQAYRWRLIARRDALMPTRTMLRFVFAGLACNNAILGRPGDLLRAQWLHRATGMGRSNALATVVVDRAFDVLALVAALAITTPLVGHGAPWLRRLDLAAGATGVVVVGVLVVTWLFTRRAEERHVTGASLVRSVSRKLTIGIGSRVGGRNSATFGGLSVLVWALWAAAAWFVARSLGIELSPVELVFLTAVVNLGAAIPSSPGFVGTFQWLCVSSLGLLAVGPTEAFAFSVLMHAVWFVPTSLVGLALLARALPSWLASRPRTGQVEPSAA